MGFGLKHVSYLRSWPVPIYSFGRGHFIEFAFEGGAMSKAKRNALVLLCVVGVLILILGMSLPTLVLSPGQPFSLGQSQPQPFGMNGLLPGGSAIVLLFRGLLALGLILFPLYILY